VIRLIFETCLEFSIAVIISLPFAIKKIRNSENWLEAFDYGLVIFLAGTVLLLPLFIIFFYCLNYEKMGTEKFQKKFGSVYEGLRINRSALFYPVLFILRRVSLAVVALYAEDFVWLQLSSQLFFTMISACYLLHFKPFDGSLI